MKFLKEKIPDSHQTLNSSEQPYSLSAFTKKHSTANNSHPGSQAGQLIWPVVLLDREREWVEGKTTVKRTKHNNS